MEGWTKIGSILAMLALLATGCSFSWSSDSISRSLDSISNSSSESSPDGDSGEARYREDVKDLIAAHVRSGGDAEALERDLGSVARHHGVNDWEADASTFVGVGQGLALAHAPDERVEAYERDLAEGDPARVAAIRRGHDAERAR